MSLSDRKADRLEGHASLFRETFLCRRIVVVRLHVHHARDRRMHHGRVRMDLWDNHREWGSPEMGSHG